MKIVSARSFASLVTGVKPYSVLFFGSEEFARVALFNLTSKPNYTGLVKRLAAVAPAVLGTNTPSEGIHELLKSKNIEKYTFRKQFKPLEKYIREQEQKDEFPFDLGIIASFSEALPPSIVNLFPKGVLVAHPSLLPKLKGHSPIEHCILNGETQTGVSLLDISLEKMLAGNLLMQKSLPVLPNDSYLSLAGKCGALAGDILADVLENLDLHRANAKPQPSTPESLAPHIVKEKAILLWDKLTMAEAARKELALRGSRCPAFTKIKTQNAWKNVFIEELKEEKDSSSDYYRKVLAPVEGKATPGVIHWSSKGMKDRVCIRCKDGWVSAENLKAEGTRSFTASSFIANQLRGDHFDIAHSFSCRFATSTDLLKITEKLEV